MEGLPVDLYRSAGVPIVSTSANISKERAVTSMEEAIELNRRTDERISAIVRGRRSHYNKPTTIIDTTTYPPTVIRTGLVDLDIVRQVIPDIHVTG